MKGDWSDVNLHEALLTMGTSFSIGLIRLLYILRQGRRKFVWFDLILEPCLAVLAGMLIWCIGEISGVPGIMKTVLASLGSWGGPKTIHALELKYLGNRRRDDVPSKPVPLD
jgi:hypothetical protein